MTDETTSHLVDLIQRDRRTDSTIVVCLLHQKIPGGIKSNTKLAIVKFFNFRLISILIGPQAKVASCTLDKTADYCTHIVFNGYKVYRDDFIISNLIRSSTVSSS